MGFSTGGELARSKIGLSVLQDSNRAGGNRMDDVDLVEKTDVGEHGLLRKNTLSGNFVGTKRKCLPSAVHKPVSRYAQQVGRDPASN